MSNSIRAVQRSFTAGVLDPVAAARTDLEKYRAGAKELTNFICLLHGGICNRPGTKYVDSIGVAGRLIPFQYSTVQTYVLCFLDKKMRIYKDGGVVIYPSTYTNPGEIVEITTPFALADLPKLKYVQSADVIFFTHPGYAPCKLTRSSHYDWTFADLDFSPNISPPTTLSISKSGFSGTAQTISYKVSAVAKSGEESKPSDAVSVQIDSYWPQGGRVTLTWGAVTNATEYNVYKNSRGYYGWVATISADDTLEYKDDYVEPDTSIGPQKWQNPFDDNNPGCCGLYQQRMVFGRSDDDPQTVWLSQTGALNNFSYSSPLQSTDSIEATIASRQVNEIRHFVPLQNMLVMTSGSEWMMSPGNNADAITPKAMRFEEQSCWGCSEIPPLVIGDNVLFVQNFGYCVRDLEYTLQSDGYRGSNLSILAKSLFDYAVTAWAYQQEPWSIVWCVREDGAALALTYMKEQQVWAWTKHVTDGKFLDVCSIKGDTKDDVYFIIRRTINSSTVYYVEYLADRLPVGSTSVQDAWFVDCGLSYSGTAVTTITGLDYLEGKTVAILADGSVLPQQTVSSGKITLSASASKVTVGLPFTSTMQSLDPDLGDDGKAIGVTKNLISVTLRLKDSGRFRIGTDADNLQEPKLDNPTTYGAPPPLYTGDVKVDLPGDYRDNAEYVIVQSDPLPLTVLATVEKISLGDL